MPEYLAPGVYIEDVKFRKIEGVSTGTAGFLGEAERGSTLPMVVTSWPDYKRNFGGFSGDNKYLPYAVNSFFENGGERCYISRIVNSDDAFAQESFGALTVRGIGPGEWGNSVYIVAGASSNTLSGGVAGKAVGFRLQVFYWQNPPAELVVADAESRKNNPADVYEDFDNLDVNESSADYLCKRINQGGSRLVQINVTSDAALGDITLEEKFLSHGKTNPVVDADYSGANLPVDVECRGLAAFATSDYNEIAILYAPAVSDTVALNIIRHCESNRYRFAIIDAPVGANDPASVNPRKSIADTSYAAFYYPWFEVSNPVTGAHTLIPPGGAMAGIYARNDNERGVWNAPANQVIRGALKLQLQIDKTIQNMLNPRGVNALRFFSRRGYRVWGVRTLSSDPQLKYINVRRLLIFLEHSIYMGTWWVVFEPNDESLWVRLRLSIAEFLRAQWREGALAGQKEDNAFFVKTGRETMTDEDIANGRIIIEIGVAPVRPAEFVIFRLAQSTGGVA